VEPRASGYLRCSLGKATPAESARFADGLDEVLGPVAAPRYLVSRLVLSDHGELELTAGAMVGRPVATVRWHAVPQDLARLKSRADVFRAAWRRWLGPSELVFTQRSDEGRRALAAAAGAGRRLRAAAARRLALNAFLLQRRLQGRTPFDAPGPALPRRPTARKPVRRAKVALWGRG
jgi:hypothetical protein